MEEINLHFDDFMADISYFNDLSLTKTLHFYIKNKHLIKSKLAVLADLLFTIDSNNNTVLYFQKKTIVGFMLVSNNFYKFKELLDIFDEFNLSTSDEITQNKLTKNISFSTSEIYKIVKQYINENIDVPSITKLYKEYFCLNYRTMKTKDVTGIKCEDKKPIIEKEIYEEIIIKLSYFIYFYTQIKDGSPVLYKNIQKNETGKHLANIIINHYILHFLKSDRGTVYNMKMILGNPKKYSSEEISLYNNFNNINAKKFKILPYLYQFTYNKKQFSTCGETTLLNILNYCLIKKDGTFNTNKILNDDVRVFYKGKSINDMEKTETFKKWLDIVSNLGYPVYNPSGDIHNNVKNVSSVLNKLVYDKDYSENIENPSQFIVDTISYLNNDIEIKINEQKTNDKQLYLTMDNYNLFFYPGHGEMYSITTFRISKYIKRIDLDSEFSKTNEDSDFYIIYSIIKEASEKVFGEVRDYDEAIESIIIKYPITFIFEIYKNIIEVFLLTVNSFRYDSNFDIDADDDNPNILYDESSIDNFLRNIRNVKKIYIEIFDIEEDDEEEIIILLKKIADSYVKYASEYCKDLTTFNIAISSNYNIHVNLKPLTKLENLENLSLYGFQLNDIKPIENLKYKEKIKYLKIDNYTDSKSFNFNFIEEFINLENLILDYINDLNPIGKLTNLKTIWFRNINEFDVKLIENLSLLEKINVYNSKIINTESFEYLINLKELAMVNCDFTSESIEPIVNLNNLEQLILHKSFGISTPVKIYNKNIKKSVIKNLERYNIEYVYQDKESSRKSGMKDIHVIKINDLQFKIKRSTKMKKIFDAFCEKYGIDVNNISFYLDDMKLNEDDTLNSLGIENEDELEIYTRPKISSTKRSSSKRSSPKRLSRSSPKRSSPKRLSRSSPKRSSSKRSSPKINNRISTTIDGKKYKKKISPKRFISFNK
jgi:hypothetical protein